MDRFPPLAVVVSKTLAQLLPPPHDLVLVGLVVGLVELVVGLPELVVGLVELVAAPLPSLWESNSPDRRKYATTTDRSPDTLLPTIPDRGGVRQPTNVTLVILTLLDILPALKRRGVCQSRFGFNFRYISRNQPSG